MSDASHGPSGLPTHPPDDAASSGRTAAFDAFYAHARGPLFVQCAALTGDPVVARRAVRDAFVAAWHRWRRLERLADPLQTVRPHAWRLALRYRSARLGHRDHPSDPEVARVLTGLGALTLPQRQAVVLVQLAAVSMEQMAREVGLPPADAERELQAGVVELAARCEVTTAEIPRLFAVLTRWSVGDPALQPADDPTVHPRAGRWPRATVIRRAGSRRRHRRAAIGVAVAVAVTLGSGAVLAASGDVRPRLDHSAVGAAGPTSPTPTPPLEPLPRSSLVGPGQAADALGGRWRVAATREGADAATDDDPRLPCRPSTPSDASTPSGLAALERFQQARRAAGGAGGPGALAQFTEASADATSAHEDYQTAVGWFAGCHQGRTQLLATSTPQRVGDESVQLLLRQWDRPARTLVVGVARTGAFTTTTVVSADRSSTTLQRGAASTLASAVGNLCTFDGGGTCAPARPRLRDADPVPVGAGNEQGLLDVVDLPPVRTVTEPWTSSDAGSAADNLAASRCDGTSFTRRVDGTAIEHAVSRTYLIDDAGLPDTFGLTETLGVLPARAGTGFVDRITAAMAACGDKMIGTEVTPLARRRDDDGSLAVWRVRFPVSAKADADFLMAVVREGTGVAQIGLLPADRATISTRDFVALAERARARLPELPSPD